MTYEQLKNAREQCEQHNIVWDINERWEKGVPHHPEAERIMELLQTSDWLFDDYFDWNTGGDGDNGETLMYSLSVLLELRDVKNNIQC